MNTTTQEEQLTIKLKLGRGPHAEMKRGTFPVPATFADLAVVLEQLGGPFGPSKRFLYQDEEGDDIALANDADLQEALRVVRASQSASKILRISVRRNRSEGDEGESNADVNCERPRGPWHRGGRRGCHGGGGPQRQQPEEARQGPWMQMPADPMAPIRALLESARASVPQLLENPALKSMAEGLLAQCRVETNFICDSCNTRISGDRYHSTTVPDFDLCSACHASPAVGVKLEDVHKFERVTALEALVATLASGGVVDADVAAGDANGAPHHRAVCDRCNRPIVGLRHKCVQCDDYDHCDACATEAHVDGHTFIVIADPSVDHRELHRCARRELNLEQQQARRAAKHAARSAAKEAAAAEKQAAEARERAEQALEQAQKLAPKFQAPKFHKEPIKPTAEEPKAPAPEVVKKPAEPVVQPRAPGAEEPSAFERNLQTLESMGFGDRKKNISVLVRNRNRLFEAIQELLNSA